RVITDHIALRWLFSVKDPNGRLARWSFFVQSYDMEILHRAGRKHTDADALSRFPVGSPESFDSSDLLSLESVDLVSRQREDPWVYSIISYIENCDSNKV